MGGAPARTSASARSLSTEASVTRDPAARIISSRAAEPRWASWRSAPRRPTGARAEGQCERSAQNLSRLPLCLARCRHRIGQRLQRIGACDGGQRRRDARPRRRILPHRRRQRRRGPLASLELLARFARSLPSFLAEASARAAARPRRIARGSRRRRWPAPAPVRRGLRTLSAPPPAPFLPPAPAPERQRRLARSRASSQRHRASPPARRTRCRRPAPRCSRRGGPTRACKRRSGRARRTRPRWGVGTRPRSSRPGFSQPSPGSVTSNVSAFVTR